MNTDGQTRLMIISQFDPLWAIAISEFVEMNPEFGTYLHMASLSYSPPLPSFYPQTVKQGVMFYICQAGVRAQYGHDLYKIVKNLKIQSDIDDHKGISQKKKEYLREAILLHDNISVEEVINRKIKGFGVGGTCWIKLHFSDRMELEEFEYTDIGIQKGLMYLYKLKKRPTPAEARKYGEKWKKNKTVGNMFCFQIYGHLVRK